MDNTMRTIHLHSPNKGFSSKFPKSYLNQQMPKASQQVQEPKRCDNNDQNEFISPKYK